MALILQRAGTIRYGVRAFSTLEGYADRNRETESAFPMIRKEDLETPGHRPGSRLRLERRQTRSSNLRAFVRLCGKYAVQGRNSPIRLCAAEDWEAAGFRA